MELVSEFILNGEITANGIGPYSSQEYSTVDMGSGAGGSIQIHTNLISGKGRIAADGFSSDNSGHGGYGGGGRVLLNLSRWFA
jgi:hypothetical protein